jgi:hypothetical protein
VPPPFRRQAPAVGEGSTRFVIVGHDFALAA